MSGAISRRISDLAEKAMGVAEHLEAGQAQKPLSQELRNLADTTYKNSLVTLALAGFSQDDTIAILSSILADGDKLSILRIFNSLSSEYFEILLQDQGFSLQIGDVHHAYDNRESFLDALENVSEGIENQDSRAPIRLQVAVSTGRKGMRLLVIRKIGDFLEKPALLSLVADQADWMMIAGGAAVSPDDGTTKVIHVLADSVSGISCLINGAGTGERGWWQGFRSCPGFGVFSLADDSIKSLLAQFEESASGIRAHIEAAGKLGKLNANIQLVIEAIESESVNLRNKHRLQAAGFAQNNLTAQNHRRCIEEIKSGLQDDLDSVKRSIEDRARRELTPDGGLYGPLKDLSESISPGDLDMTPAGNSIRLVLSPRKQESLRAALIRHGRRMLEEDLDIIYEAVNLTANDIGLKVESVVGSGRKIVVDYPDINKVWDSIVSMAHPEVRYRGEMPKVTLGARLMSARQGMMWVMMAGMLVTGVTAFTGNSEDSQRIRSFLYALMVPVFAGGLIYSFRSFKIKEKQILDKETEKLKEGVFQELRKVMSEILRHEQSLLGQFFQRVSRDIQSQVNARMQESEDQKNQNKESQRKQLSDMGRSIDERLRELERRKSELTRLGTSLRECERHLREDRNKISFSGR